MPFTLFVEDDGHVGVLADLLGLQFNLHIGTMHVEQEHYCDDGNLSEIILVQKNRSEVGAMWILGLGLFRVISLLNSQMQTSTVNTTNKSSKSTIQIPSVATVILEPNDDNILVLLDFNDNVCLVVDLHDTSPFHYRIRSPFPVNVSMDVEVCFLDTSN